MFTRLPHSTLAITAPLLLLAAFACTTETPADDPTDTGTGGSSTGGGDGTGGRPEGGAGGEGGEASGFFTGPIAPECEEGLDWCAQVEVAALLSCVDVDLEPYTITTEFSGKTDGVSCGIDADGELTLRFSLPQDDPAYDVYAARFSIADYTGPGTYPLVSGMDKGLTLQGVPVGASSSQDDEDVAWAIGGYCGELACDAIVHEESEPILDDPQSVHAFRVRVEIVCDPDVDFFGNDGGDCAEPENHCALQGTPTLKFDVNCTH